MEGSSLCYMPYYILQNSIWCVSVPGIIVNSPNFLGRLSDDFRHITWGLRPTPTLIAVIALVIDIKHENLLSSDIDTMFTRPFFPARFTSVVTPVKSVNEKLGCFKKNWDLCQDSTCVVHGHYRTQCTGVLYNKPWWVCQHKDGNHYAIYLL